MNVAACQSCLSIDGEPAALRTESEHARNVPAGRWKKVVEGSKASTDVLRTQRAGVSTPAGQWKVTCSEGVRTSEAVLS